jgi:NAD(P)-dependent dehydrogenase (short-subunit alcohol dehydrogenase family)
MERELLGMKGRTAIVVGAGGGGIGTAIAATLAAAGTHVVAVDLDAARLEAAEEAIRAVDGLCTAKVVDARDRAAVEHLVAQVDEDGGLHGLVNVVGGLPIERWQRLLEYSDETFDGVLEANLRCAFLTSQVVAQHLARRGAPGSIVQIASISALHGMPFGAAYSAAKAALISLSRTMALEWGPLGIRVNAVAPGTIRVPRNQAGDDAERDRAVIPLGRRGTPEDIAGAVLFLLSDLAQWVTGQLLAVDGGVSVKPSYLDETGLPVFVTDPKVRDRLSG